MDGFQIYNIKGHIDKEDTDKYTNIWIYLKVFEDKMFCFIQNWIRHAHITRTSQNIVLGLEKRHFWHSIF